MIFAGLLLLTGACVTVIVLVLLHIRRKRQEAKKEV